MENVERCTEPLDTIRYDTMRYIFSTTVCWYLQGCLSRSSRLVFFWSLLLVGFLLFIFN